MFKKTIVKAAAAQIAPVLENKNGTLGKIADAIIEASNNNADIIVFAETLVPNYPYFSFIKPAVTIRKDHTKLYEQAVVVPSEDTKFVGDLAKESFKKKKNNTNLSRTYDLGSGRWKWLKSSRHQYWKNRGTCLLGTLQSLSSFCFDERS